MKTWVDHSTGGVGSLLTYVPVLGFAPGYAIFPPASPHWLLFFSPFDLRRINSAWLPSVENLVRWVRQGHMQRGIQQEEERKIERKETEVG